MNTNILKIKKMKTKLFTLLTVIFTGFAFSQSHTIVPIALEDNYGGYNTYVTLNPNNISFQFVYHENQLTSMIEKELTGFTFRLPQSGYNNSQPAVDLDYENFDIYISEGVSPSDFTSNFAGNVVGAQTQVRSGALKITPNTFPFSNTSTPPDFGQIITFDTPYTYNGGHLLIEIRENPAAGSVGIRTDVIPAGNPLSGSVANGVYKTVYQNPHIQGSSSGSGYVPVIRFTYCDVVAPPTGEANQTFNVGQTLADLVVNGDNLVWYSDNTYSNALSLSEPLVDGATYYVRSENGTCQSEALAITVEEQASRSNFDIFGFTYYPNPVNDILTFSSNQPIDKVVVSNMLGQEVKVHLSSDKTNLDMSNLPSGNYLVKVTIEGVSKTIKVMKQ